MSLLWDRIAGQCKGLASERLRTKVMKIWGAPRGLVTGLEVVGGGG